MQVTYNGKAGSRRLTSSTTLKSSIFWSGAAGPRVTKISSLLGSQHVAVISDAALPTLWQIFRRFLMLCFFSYNRLPGVTSHSEMP